MNKYLKIVVTVALCGCCLSTMAANRFMVQFKLSEERKAILRQSYPGVGTQEFEILVAEELMKKLTTEQLAVLSAAATKVKGKVFGKIEVIDWQLVGGRGAHVVHLSEDLDENQTKQFLKEIEIIEQIESIEASTRVQPF